MFITMPEDIINDLMNIGTKRPNAKPLLKARRQFIPIILPDFNFKITLSDNVSLDNLITLFIMYYTPEIIDTIVQYTNQYQKEPRDSSRPDARALQ
jgi:hypothetical protein